MNNINILLNGNDTIYAGMELVIYSLLTHNKGCNIYVLTMDYDLKKDDKVNHFTGLTDWQKNKLRTIVKYLDATSHIKIIDTHDLYVRYFEGGVNQYSGFTPYAPLRLLADVILTNIDEVLYLDCDTAVTGDIRKYYYEYANKDTNYSAYFTPDRGNGFREMVSGVVLFNLKKIRQTGFLEKARDNFVKNEYRYPDQDAMRDADTATIFPDTLGYCETLELVDEMPLILHFTNTLSPKVYNKETGREYFYRRFPFLKYVKEGAERLDTIFDFHKKTVI